MRFRWPPRVYCDAARMWLAGRLLPPGSSVHRDCDKQVNDRPGSVRLQMPNGDGVWVPSSKLAEDESGSIVRLSIPGNVCVFCGAQMTKDVLCPGCGWVDPPTRRPQTEV